LTIEVLVSDSVQPIVSGQFASGKTKSISAYEVLRKLKEKRVLVSVRTRLHYYTNMIIEGMNVSDDYKSANSLKGTVSLRQVMMAVVPVEYVTLTKRQAVVETNKGTKSATDGQSILSAAGQPVGN
jgi:tRNA U34 2-thiouridine synthase MnmA/TrmU